MFTLLSSALTVLKIPKTLWCQKNPKTHPENPEQQRQSYCLRSSSARRSLQKRVQVLSVTATYKETLTRASPSRSETGRGGKASCLRAAADGNHVRLYRGRPLRRSAEQRLRSLGKKTSNWNCWGKLSGRCFKTQSVGLVEAETFVGLV